MANIVDPDQEQSDLGLHCLQMPFCRKILVLEILGHLPYHVTEVVLTAAVVFHQRLINSPY